MNVTFVIPVFNERETLEPLAAGIAEHVAPYPYRLIFVDDGSTDGSDATLRALRDADSSVEVIRLRGNFGKSAALAAGFARAGGDVVFTMDSDLQDDPREIPRSITGSSRGCFQFRSMT